MEASFGYVIELSYIVVLILAWKISVAARDVTHSGIFTQVCEALVSVSSTTKDGTVDLK